MRDNNLVCKIPSTVSFLGIYRPSVSMRREREATVSWVRLRSPVSCSLEHLAALSAYLMHLSPNASEKPWGSVEEVGISPVRKLEQGLEMLDFLRKGRELNLMGELRDFQE